MKLDKKHNRLRRARKGRAKISELEVNRLSIHRTPQHIYAQIIGTDGGTVLDHVGDHQNLRMALHEALAVFVGRGDVQLAETPRKGDLLRGGEALIAEHDHRVIEESLLNLGEEPVVDRLGQIDTADLGADVRGERGDFER